MRDITVVFDLDGTLIDTAPDLISAANRAVVRAGHEPIAYDRLRPVISFGSRRMIAEALALQAVSLPEPEIDRICDDMVADYASNIAGESRPFPGLIQVLDYLSDAGAGIAVCTNKREDLARLLLDTLGLTPRFRAITGRDTFPVCKPDPEHLLGTLRLSGGRRDRAVMVGDSDVDVKTAKAAAIPVIGVTFGYTETPVPELGCDAVISGYDEFLEAFSRVTPRR